MPDPRRRRRTELRARDGLLPADLEPFFWEYDFSQLRWDKDRDLTISRILAAGDWDSVKWLMGQLGRRGLRQWIVQRRGRGLDARQLRFWELVLGIPHRQVTEWIMAADGIWTRRTFG